MSSVVCPRCNRKTNELEVLGHCEHCGHSALEASGIQVEDATPAESRQHGATHCALCGSDGPLQPFILRTYSVTNFFGQVTRKWCDFPAECCDDCYRTVARLQRFKLL